MALQPGHRLSVLAGTGEAVRLQPADGRQGLRRPQQVRVLRGRVAARRPGATLGAEGHRRTSRSTCSRPAARTGIPKSRIGVEDFRIDYRMFSDTLPEDKFPKGSNWLMLGPSGPRRLRLAVEHLAQHRGGICFCVDLDPRWVIKLIKKGWMEHLKPTRSTSSIRRSRSSAPGTTSSACSPRRSCSKRWRCGSRRRERASTRPASPAFSPAARSSRRSGPASRTRSCSTAST